MAELRCALNWIKNDRAGFGFKDESETGRERGGRGGGRSQAAEEAASFR